ELTQTELLVAGGGLTAGAVPAVQLAEEQPQHRSLELVEARVVADRLEVLLLARAVKAQERDAVGELLVVRANQAAVPEREDVLGRKEAEGRDDSGTSNALRAKGLCRVLDDRHAELGEPPERHDAAEQVHGHQ